MIYGASKPRCSGGWRRSTRALLATSRSSTAPIVGGRRCRRLPLPGGPCLRASHAAEIALDLNCHVRLLLFQGIASRFSALYFLAEHGSCATFTGTNCESVR